nr:DNA-binding WRKY [Tanacetum cinerariifolium]
MSSGKGGNLAPVRVNVRVINPKMTGFRHGPLAGRGGGASISYQKLPPPRPPPLKSQNFLDTSSCMPIFGTSTFSSYSSFTIHSSSLKEVVGEKLEAEAGEEDEHGGWSIIFVAEMLLESGGILLFSVLNLLLLVLPASELLLQCAGRHGPLAGRGGGASISYQKLPPPRPPPLKSRNFLDTSSCMPIFGTSTFSSYSSFTIHSSSLKEVVGEKLEAEAGEEDEHGGWSIIFVAEMLLESGASASSFFPTTSFKEEECEVNEEEYEENVLVPNMGMHEDVLRNFRGLSGGGRGGGSL